MVRIWSKQPVILALELAIDSVGSLALGCHQGNNYGRNMIVHFIREIIKQGESFRSRYPRLDQVDQVNLKALGYHVLFSSQWVGTIHQQTIVAFSAIEVN
jgi:hypothetical protein